MSIMRSYWPEQSKHVGSKTSSLEDFRTFLCQGTQENKNALHTDPSPKADWPEESNSFDTPENDVVP